MKKNLSNTKSGPSSSTLLGHVARNYRPTDFPSTVRTRAYARAGSWPPAPPWLLLWGGNSHDWDEKGRGKDLRMKACLTLCWWGTLPEASIFQGGAAMNHELASPSPGRDVGASGNAKRRGLGGRDPAPARV
jgi:hypothetical protein